MGHDIVFECHVDTLSQIAKSTKETYNQIPFLLTQCLSPQSEKCKVNRMADVYIITLRAAEVNDEALYRCGCLETLSDNELYYVDVHSWTRVDVNKTDLNYPQDHKGKNLNEI